MMEGYDLSADKQAWKQNCLNTVRLIAALSVMCGHAFVQMRVAMPAAVSMVLGFLRGVPIFFFMSGFLVWNSVENSANFLSYAKKRFWRIYPELWTAVGLGVAVLLLLYKEPIEWGWLVAFTLTQGTVLQFWTPDFLRGYGCGTPNGALWTICVTVQFYIAVYFLHKLLHGKKWWIWIVLILASVGVSAGSVVLRGLLPEILYKLYGQTLVPYFWLFLLGAMAAEKRDAVIPFLRKYWMLFLAAAVLIYAVGIDVYAYYGVFVSTTLTMGLLGFAYAVPAWNVRVDISYGIYVYHMIVVNAMIELGFTGKARYLLAAMLLSCLIAFASERTVSRLALRKRQEHLRP